jgi:large subunit ribosomal protein L35
MPKLKTRSGAKKRFQVKKSGQVKHARAYGKHLFTFSKSMDRRRRNRGTENLKPMDAKKVIRELFPYGAN